MVVHVRFTRCLDLYREIHPSRLQEIWDLCRIISSIICHVKFRKNFRGMKMDLLTFIFSAICLGYAVWACYTAYQQAQKRIIGNQAQNVISLGVLFTFIGIAISLWNFNTDTDQMMKSINTFIEGMKTAFYTSIIGMGAALIIKYIQHKAECMDDSEYRESLTDIKSIAKGIASNTETVKSGLQGVETSIASNTDTVERGLQAVKASVDAGSSERLSLELFKMTTTLNDFVAATNESQSDMKRIADGMTVQAEMLQKLGVTLTTSMSSFSETQEKQITAMGQIMQDNMNILAEKFQAAQDKMTNSIQVMDNNMSGKLQELSTSLVEKLEDSGSKQVALLQNMEGSIASMRENGEKAAQAAVATLEETRAYQKQSLANEAQQNEILNRNTLSILAMGESFDTFVNNVKEVFGEAVIGALNRSMQNLNDQLEKQFGENFKELNDAVKAINVWQDKYKDIVDESIRELTLIQQNFKHFEDVVSKNVTEHVDTLNSNLQTFMASTEANVAVQADLKETVDQLYQMVNAAHESIDATQNVFNKFNNFTSEVIANTNEGLAAHGDAVKQHLDEMTTALTTSQQTANQALIATGEKNAEALQGMSQEFIDAARDVKDAALTLSMDTGHYVKQFGETSQAVIKETADTLERFKVDFKNNAAEAVGNLESMFEVMAKNTDKQQDKAVKTLAAQLAKITGQMVDNYNALMSRIAELDKLVGKNGGRG